MPAKGHSIDVRGLTKQFGDFTAVNQIDLTVESGEVFGYIGSNGAGKTTSIRMLCGVLEPSAGEGTVAGYDVIAEPEKVKQNIGYMSQSFSLYRDLTAEENIDFYSGIYQIPSEMRDDRKQWVLEMARLTDFRDEFTADLPRGLKQRLALGCALLHRPDIVFLDEPTSGVDPRTSREFWETIHRIADDGTTVFVTTHYMDEAEYCDRLSLLHAGEILESGTPDELRSDALDDQTFQIEGSATEEIYRAVQDLNGVVHATINRDLVELVLAKSFQVKQLREFLTEKGYGESSIESMETTLDYVFMEAIHRYEQANGDDP